MSGVKSERLPKYWPIVVDRIRSCLSEYADGELTADDIFDRLQAKDMQLWVAIDEEQDRIMGIVVTEVIQYPRISVVSVVVLAGANIHKWEAQMFNLLETWGRAIKCSKIEARARRGVARAFAKFGFQETYTVVSCWLEKVQLH